MDNFSANTWFVTGATGLVGSTIIEELHENEIHVIALVRKGSPQHMIDFLDKLNVKVIYGDILDQSSYINFLPTCDIVVHTAATVQNRDKKQNWKVNLDGTQKICDAMRKVGIQRLIHISTAGVYGKVKKKPLDETSKTFPYGDYLRSKYAAEELILSNYEDLSTTIIRPPFIFGEPDRDRHIYSSLIDSLPTTILPRIWRNDPELGFVHAEDIARLVLHAGSLAKTPSKIYNIQSFAIRLSDLYSMINQARETKTPIIPIPYLIAYMLASLGDMIMKLQSKSFKIRQRLAIVRGNWIFDTKRAREELGFRPMHTESSELERLMTEYYHGNVTSSSIRDAMTNINSLMSKEEQTVHK